ncbi:MAG: hypothetical protein II670_02055 [Alphaproteobacteria bacterium]|nr:hypothetical protein [Alphaproteobacteria bacterium]
MKKTMKSWNSTLRTESVKHREMRLAGLLPKKKVKPIRTMSKTMRTRVSEWRKNAKDICTIDGQLWCPLCGKMIVDGKYDAHHYMQRRGQAHSIDNDKYVVALHPYCHRNINHNDLTDFYCARDKILATLKLWGK